MVTVPIGMVQAFPVTQGHPHILCWPTVVPPHLGILEPGGLTWAGIPNLLLWAVTNLCDLPAWFHLPRTVARSRWPQYLDCPQRLPVTLSVMGLETGFSYWYGGKMLGTLHCTNLQPWTFFSDGCMTVYDFLTTSDSPIANDHGWWSDSNSLFCLWGGPQLPTPARVASQATARASLQDPSFISLKWL